MFQVSPLFSSHGVLPVGKELRIFGQAGEGEAIRAIIMDQSDTITGESKCIARDGRFLLHLPPQRLGSVLRLKIWTDTQTFEAEDLRVGLLVMAGGQSNMEWCLWNADEGRIMLETHEAPLVRYLNIPRVSVLDEPSLRAHANAHWQEIHPHQGADMSAVAYFFAMKVHRDIGWPVGVIGCNWGGTSILSWMDDTALHRCRAAEEAADKYERETADISIEQWQSQQDAFLREMDEWNQLVARIQEDNPGIEWSEVEAKAGVCPWHPSMGPWSPYRPGRLAKTMVDFVAPAALSGILFYQGEADLERAEDYGDLLITLVTRWREIFRDPELPFYNIQLPMYQGDADEKDRNWAVLRLQQEKAWHALRESYLAVMTDAGEKNNIHPTDKRTPGERLAELFMERFTSRPSSQCWARRKETHGRVLTVELTQPVKAVRGDADLFEIAGEDGVFYPAKAELDGYRIHLSADEVDHPVMARYAWVNYAPVHVFTQDGRQPLAPFWLD